MFEPIQIKDRSSEFLAERGPNEIDLLKVVKDLFVVSGIGNKTYLLDNYFEAYKITNRKPEVQRFYMNKFFTLQLLQVNKNTIDERFCLINDGTIDDWIRLFKSKILPFLIENNLPY